MRSSRSLFRKKAPQRWSAVRGSGRGEPRSGGCIVGTGAVLADQRSGWLRVPGREKSSSAPCETGRSWRDLQCTWNRAQASCGFACGRRLYMPTPTKNPPHPACFRSTASHRSFSAPSPPPQPSPAAARSRAKCRSLLTVDHCRRDDRRNEKQKTRVWQWTRPGHGPRGADCCGGSRASGCGT
jgi:hypothetical protein